MMQDDPSRSERALAAAVVVRDVMQEDPPRPREALAPAVVVRDVMQEDHSRPRKAPAAAVKHSVIIQREQEARVKEICEHPRQGQLIRSLPHTLYFTSHGAESVGRDLGDYTKVIPGGCAAHDVIPHNVNLHL